MFRRAAALILMLTALTVQAQTPPVQIRGAWVRAAVPGQTATSAFAQLMAPQGARLVEVSTPGAAMAEVHEMQMQGDVMQMRAMTQGLELPPGKVVELTPAHFHIMLMQLRQPLPVGAKLPLTFKFVDGKGRASHQTVQVPVALMPPQPSQAAKP